MSNNNEDNDSDFKIPPSRVPQLTGLSDDDDHHDADESGLGVPAWDVLSKRFPNTAHVLCELNEVINHSRITLSEFTSTVSSFKMDKNDNARVGECKKLSNCKLFTRDASVSTIETQTSAEDIERDVLKMSDCKKSMKDASVYSNIDYLPEGLSMGSIENDDDDEDEGCGKKKSFSSFSSLFFNCGSYDLRYSRENTFSASINAVGDESKVTEPMYRTEKAHPLVKDSKLKYANKSTPFAKHTEAIKSRESSGSSDQDYKGAEILTPTITTKDAVFKTVEPRISTPVNDKLITAIREPTSPQTESIQSRETCRLSTPIDEPQQNYVLNNPSIRRRASRASSIPISQNAKISPKKKSRIPRKSPSKDIS